MFPFKTPPPPPTKKKSTDNTGWWRNPGECWAHLPISDHEGGLYRAQIFPKNNDSVLTISVNSPCQRLWHRHACGILLKQVHFLTVNHCRPFPLRELHSTHDNRSSVERPWGILSLCKTRFWLPVNLREFYSTKDNRSHVGGILLKQVVFLWITAADPSPLGNFTPLKTTDLVWRDPGGSWACLWPGSNYKWNHLSRGCDTDIYVCGIFMKQVVFLTVNHRGPLPFRELHSTDDNRSSVERPWGILSLFTTCSDYEWIHISRGSDTDIYIYVCGIFMKQVVFLMVNHRGPLPFRELHSTDDNRSSVERPWGILSLFTTCSDYEWIHISRGSDTDIYIYVCGILMKQVVFLMVNHRGPLPFRELHSTDDNRSSVERPWGILSLFTTYLQLRVNSHFQRLWHRHIYVCGIFVKQVVFLTVNHRGPLPFRELHSTDDNRSSVERPWGILSLFTTCSDYEWIHISRGCDTDIYIYVCGIFMKQVIFLTVNHRGPLPFRELHSTDDNRYSVERPWGILSLFTT